MHRNNRHNFLYNYKYINIHNYRNCLYKCNINKILNYVRHYFKKHNIKYKDLSISIGRWELQDNSDNESYIPTMISVCICNTNKWITIFKLICEENEVELKLTYGNKDKDNN